MKTQYKSGWAIVSTSIALSALLGAFAYFWATWAFASEREQRD
jgi:hypothetical protein